MSEQTALVKRLEQFELEADTKQRIIEKFNQFVATANEWEQKARSIVVTDPTQVFEMKMAKEARMILRKVRIDAEHLKKDLKRDALVYGKAVDFVYNFVEDTCKPLEAHLEAQEKFVELQEEKRKTDLQSARMIELAPYVDNPAVFDLANMPEDTYRMVLGGSKKSYFDKIEAEKKAMEDAEKERLRQIEVEKENAILKAEADRKERELQAERDAAAEKTRQIQVEAEKKLADEREKARKIQAAQDEQRKKEQLAAQAKIKAEKDKADKLAKEIKDREEREKQQKADAEKKLADEQKKARLAPDKDKLQKLAETFSNIELPEVKSDDAKTIVKGVYTMLGKMVGYIEEKIQTL